MKYTTTTTTTSTVPDKYWDDQDDGYKTGFDWAVRQVNDRFMTWLFVGFFIGLTVMFYVNSGALNFLSIIALIYLVDKVKEINTPSQNK